MSITPLRQKPHCMACSSMNACWSGCGFVNGPEPFQRRDRRAFLESTHGRDTRPHRATVDEHRAASALRQAASELRPVERKVVAQDIQQRCAWIGIDPMGCTVHGERHGAHGRASFAAREARGSRRTLPGRGWQTSTMAMSKHGAALSVPTEPAVRTTMCPRIPYTTAMAALLALEPKTAVPRARPVPSNWSCWSRPLKILLASSVLVLVLDSPEHFRGSSRRKSTWRVTTCNSCKAPSTSSC